MSRKWKVTVLKTGESFQVMGVKTGLDAQRLICDHLKVLWVNTPMRAEPLDTPTALPATASVPSPQAA
jgi:hypothetical protein